MNMRMTSLIIGSLAVLGPVSTLAADEIETDTIEPAEILNSLPMKEGYGGGGADMSYYPYPGYGIMVDATVTKEVTPDLIALNAYCDLGRSNTREEAQKMAEKAYQNIKTVVGSDGIVRKSGSFSIYPYYLSDGKTDGYSANINLYIRITRPTAAARIGKAVEDEGCGMNWDVRLTDTQSYELSILNELSSKASKRKEVFETLLKKKLTHILSASLNTWIDGYSTYDPDTNRAEATTTLSMSYALEDMPALPNAALENRPEPRPMLKNTTSLPTSSASSSLKSNAEMRRMQRLQR